MAGCCSRIHDVDSVFLTLYLPVVTINAGWNITQHSIVAYTIGRIFL